MKTLLLILMVAVVSGCSHTRITRTEQGIDAKNTRLFWASEGIDISYTTTNGVTATAKIKKSSASDAAMDMFKAGLDAGKRLTP